MNKTATAPSAAEVSGSNRRGSYSGSSGGTAAGNHAADLTAASTATAALLPSKAPPPGFGLPPPAPSANASHAAILPTPSSALPNPSQQLLLPGQSRLVSLPSTTSAASAAPPSSFLRLNNSQARVSRLQDLKLVRAVLPCCPFSVSFPKSNDLIGYVPLFISL